MSAKTNKTKKNKSTGLMRRQPETPMFAGGDFPFAGATPFRMMRRFMDDMDRMFEDFNGFRMTPFFEPTELAFPDWAEFEKKAWSPQIEVLRHNGEMTVRADLPGLKREDINVEIADSALVLSGERKEEKEEKKDDFYRSELSYGSFYRSIPVPETVTPENVSAKFDNGVLEIKIAVPTAELKGKKIEIQAAEPKAPKAVGATT
jgi:HSP20 family protein